MLKPRNNFATQKQFDSAFFREYATVSTYALDPYAGSYVVLLSNNDKVKHLEFENRYFFITKDGKSKDYLGQDALDLHAAVKEYRELDRPGVKTRETNTGFEYQCAVNGFAKFLYLNTNTSKLKLFSNVTTAVARESAKEEYAARWTAYLDRLEEIMLAVMFRCMNDEEHVVSSAFTMDSFTMIPVVNPHVGVNKYSSLRLQHKKGSSVSSINFNYGKDCVHLSGSVAWKAKLPVVVEAFISGLDEIIAEFKEYIAAETSFDRNMYIGSRMLVINEIRTKFMEYVFGREAGGVSHEGSYRALLLTMNSEVAPGGSKVFFHYHPQFMEDLYAGLRHLAKETTV